MDKDFYDTTFLYDNLYLAESAINEVIKWSVNNGDKGLEKISKAKESFEQAKKELFNEGKKIDSQKEEERDIDL